MRLTETYRPLTVDAFVGLPDAKRIVGQFLRKPESKAFLLIGASGTGKTRMAEAIARALNGDISHYNFIQVDSQRCNVEAVQDIKNRLAYAPWGSFWVIVVNEAPEMTAQAQTAFLSLLDAIPERTIIIFTGNGKVKDSVVTFDKGGLELRFLSRCMVVHFSNYGLNGEGSAFLRRVWESEGGDGEPPDFERILKDQRNNLRASLNCLERALLERGPHDATA